MPITNKPQLDGQQLSQATEALYWHDIGWIIILMPKFKAFKKTRICQD